ncbi:MAG: endospore germination permease, partial [Oscillospiraceae bacterium]|nr:endospore germination permease [Oscillospiraceae bacterium]
MNIEKSRISPLQFMFAIMCFIRSSSLLSSFFTPIVNQDSWLVIIFGMIVSLPVLWIYISLSKAFPKSNLIEINDLVFGRIGGKIISAFYLWFFFTLTALNLRDLGIFVGKSTMSKTPPVLIIIVFILLCAWAVYYGLEVVTRYGIVFILISSAILLLSFLVSVNIMHRESFLPILNQPLKSYIQGTNIITMIPFGELVVFLMIVPYVDFKQKKLVRYFMGGFLLGGLLLLAVILRDLAILGNTLKYFSLPSFETLRIIRLFDSLGHMEILFAILLI